MPPRLTIHHRRVRSKRDQLTNQAAVIVLEELQRLLRDMRGKLRRLDRTRPKLRKWEEAEHPRDKGGEFAAGSGGGGVKVKRKLGGTSISDKDYGDLAQRVTSDIDYSMFGRHAARWTGESDYEARDLAFSIARNNKDLHQFLLHEQFGQDLPEEVTLYRVGNVRGEEDSITSFFPDRGKAERYSRRMDVDQITSYSAQTDDIVPSGAGSGEVWARDYYMKKLRKAAYQSQDLWGMFRTRLQTRLAEALRDGIITLAMLEAEHAQELTGTPVNIDTDQLSRDFADQLGLRIKDVEVSVRRDVGRKVSAWYNTPGATLEDIITDLSGEDGPFSRYRAELVARTEITHLNSGVHAQIAEQTGVTEWWWSTRNDASVCQRKRRWMRGPDGQLYTGCRALHGRRFAIGQPMPPQSSHPNCRCSPILIYTRAAAMGPGAPEMAGVAALAG